MEYCNVLKVDYMDTLRFKHLSGVSTVPDLSLRLTMKQSVSLLKSVRECLRNGSSQKYVDVGNYEVNIATFMHDALQIHVIEQRGEMCAPLGSFNYDKYLGGKSLLQGITGAINILERELEEFDDG